MYVDPNASAARQNVLDGHETDVKPQYWVVFGSMWSAELQELPL